MFLSILVGGRKKGDLHVRNPMKLTHCSIFFGIAVVLVGSLCTFPKKAQAQTGDNAIYNASGTCSPCTPSSAFIDASVFLSVNNPTVCAVLHGILNGSLLGS